MAKRRTRSNGNGHAPNPNIPALYDIWGQTAGVVCLNCGGPFVVSAFTDRQFSAHWQGWRVCPHCHHTEATIWWAGYDDTGRTVYDADQRFLSPEEREQVAGSKPTKRGSLRLTHARRKVTGKPERW